MIKSRMIRFIVSDFVFSLILGIMAIRFFSQETPSWKNIFFAAHHNALKFFDYNTGKIYVYSEFDGDLRGV